MTVAPMVVSAATHGVNGVGIDYATGALTSLLVFSLNPENHRDRRNKAHRSIEADLIFNFGLKSPLF